MARDLTEVPRSPEADEHIEVTTHPLPEAIRMAGSGEILDAGSVIALLRFALLSRSGPDGKGLLEA